MADFKATTALATLEEKLRRALQLAGQIGASFVPELKPTIIAGDLREPGNSSFNGRHFAVSAYGTYNGVNQWQSILFPYDCLVTSMIMTASGSGQFAGWLTPPNVAPASNPVPFLSVGTWTDRKLVTADAVAFLMSTQNGCPLLGTDLSLTNAFANSRLQAGPPQNVIASPLMLPAGSHINFKFTAAADVGFSIQGRIWP